MCRDRLRPTTFQTQPQKKPPLLKGAGAEPFTGLAGESHPVACSGLNQVDAYLVGRKYIGSRVIVSSCKHGAGNG